MKKMSNLYDLLMKQTQYYINPSMSGHDSHISDGDWNSVDIPNPKTRTKFYNEILEIFAHTVFNFAVSTLMAIGLIKNICSFKVFTSSGMLDISEVFCPKLLYFILQNYQYYQFSHIIFP